MARIVGDIAVQVGADVSPLQRGMKKGAASVENFQDKAQKMALNVAKAGAAVVTAMAAVTAGVLKMASEAAAAGKEIQNLSDVAGVSTTEFQRLAIASETVGIEQQKLADIFKDVNDKFGDYMATGAGPLADFFENIAPKVGVTAEQFANLAGPQALELYVQSLDKAGLSQQQMTFYMEALASDATALLPLLGDNGRAMRELGDEAEAAGRIMSQDMIDAAVEMDRELTALTDTLKTQATEAVLEYKDEILAAADIIVNTLIPAMGAVFDAAVAFAQDIGIAVMALRNFADVADGILSQDGTRIAGAGPTPESLGIPGAGTSGEGPSEREGAALLDLYGTGEVSPENLSPNTEPLTFDAGVPNFTPTFTPSGGRSGGGGGSRSRGRSGGGSRSGPDRDDLEALMERYAAEAEQLEMHQASELEKLEEYRQAKLGTEEEFNELERQIKEDHLNDMAELEAAANRARLQDIGGAFGDLASLMTTENAKLFKIGQASAIAEATISGYQAAVDAWQKGMKIGGPPVAAAFSAASVVKTGALINQIASASPTGSSGGGAAASGGSIASAATGGSGSNLLNVSLTNLAGDGLYSGAEISSLFDSLGDEAKARGFEGLRFT